MSDQNRETHPATINSSKVAKVIGVVAAGVVGANGGENADAAPVVVPVSQNLGLQPFTVSERDHQEMLLRVGARRPISFSTGLETFTDQDPSNSMSTIFLSMQSLLDSSTMGGVFIDSSSGGNIPAVRAFDFTELIPASSGNDQTAEKVSLKSLFNAGPQVVGFTFTESDPRGGENEFAALMVLDFSGDRATGERSIFVDRIVYESDPNTPLPASAANIPEPGSAALATLAAGAAAVGLRRRAKHKPEPASA